MLVKVFIVPNLKKRIYSFYAVKDLCLFDCAIGSLLNTMELPG